MNQKGRKESKCQLFDGSIPTVSKVEKKYFKTSENKL